MQPAPGRDDLELVVARHREDLGWLRRVPPAFRVTVYDKSGDPAAPHPLPNVGHESHTYLHHVATRYDELATVTVYCQGKPFDHVPDFHRVLRRLARGTLTVNGFLWLGFLVDRDDRSGSLVFRHWHRNSERRPLPMTEFWTRLWTDPVPDEFVFYPGAHFAVTAEQARRRPRTFYERALDVIISLPDAGHCFERCWDRVFDAEGVSPEYRRARLPIYFRPIRRLGLTWNHVPPPPFGRGHDER